MITSAGHRGDAARVQEWESAAFYLLKPIRHSEIARGWGECPGFGRTGGEQKGAITTDQRYSARMPSPQLLRILLAEDNAGISDWQAGVWKRGHSIV